MAAIQITTGYGTILTTDSGDKVVTSGLSFTPRLVMFWQTGATGRWSTTNLQSMSYGFALSSTERGCIHWRSRDGQAAATASRAIYNDRVLAFSWWDAPFVRVNVDFKTMDASGFTLTVNDAPNSNRYFAWIAYGGDLGDMAIKEFTMPVHGGTAEFTGVGFRPRVVNLIGTGQTEMNTLEDDAVVSMGWGGDPAAGSINDMVLSSIDLEGEDPTVCKHYCKDDACLATIDPGDVTAFTNFGKWDSANADGFDLTVPTTTASEKFLALCIERGEWQFGKLTVTDDDVEYWDWLQEWTPVGMPGCFMTGNVTEMTAETPESEQKNSVGWVGNGEGEEDNMVWTAQDDVGTSDVKSTFRPNLVGRHTNDVLAQLNEVNVRDWDNGTRLQVQGVVNNDYNERWMYFLLIGDSIIQPIVSSPYYYNNMLAGAV